MTCLVLPLVEPEVCTSFPTRLFQPAASRIGGEEAKLAARSGCWEWLEVDPGVQGCFSGSRACQRFTGSRVE